MTTLDRITLTGADDTVDPAALVALWQEFPKVEWGILFSRDLPRTPRYPSQAWVEQLLIVAPPEMPLAAHLCGHYMRAALAGRYIFTVGVERFKRIQLNFAGQPQAGSMRGIRLCPGELILQADGVNDIWIRSTVSETIVPLFDLSAGTGQVPPAWPTPWPGVSVCGYAGGLGPDTLEAEWGRICTAAPDALVWLDMESSLRSVVGGFDTFDLDKVRAVLTLLQVA